MPKLTIRNNTTKLTFKVELLGHCLFTLKPKRQFTYELEDLYVKCKVYRENGEVYFERGQLDTDSFVGITEFKVHVHFEDSTVERPFTDFMYLQVADVLKEVEVRNAKLGKKEQLSYKDSLCYTLRLHEIEEMLRYEQLCDIIMDLKGLTPEDVEDSKRVKVMIDLSQS